MENMIIVIPMRIKYTAADHHTVGESARMESFAPDKPIMRYRAVSCASREEGVNAISRDVRDELLALGFRSITEEDISLFYSHDTVANGRFWVSGGTATDRLGVPAQEVIREEEFDRRFRPEVESGGSYEQWEWSHEKDAAYIRTAIEENRCWTAIEDDDGVFCITEGNRIVNRIYNIITELPYDPATMYTVQDPEDKADQLAREAEQDAQEELETANDL